LADTVVARQSGSEEVAMADIDDRDESETGGGNSSFVIGLLAGTVLGAGLGMLFAPKLNADDRGAPDDRSDALNGETRVEMSAALSGIPAVAPLDGAPAESQRVVATRLTESATRLT
jgi:hypothetical protein